MRPAFRNDAYAKVSGKAKYTDDYSMPQMLHAAPLHAEMASARILDIDCTEALKLEGVKRIITARDIPGAIKFGQIIRDYPTWLWIVSVALVTF
jgi:CO/xanthine dehydrogenase Mo-binding subunit